MDTYEPRDRERLSLAAAVYDLLSMPMTWSELRAEILDEWGGCSTVMLLSTLRKLQRAGVVYRSHGKYRRREAG